jgi:hypothetical protein
MTYSLASTIKFNALKHHASFLMNTIPEWKNQNMGTIIPELSELGDNQFDVYTGHLSVHQITHQVCDYMTNLKITERQSFQKWIGKKHYRELVLSDCSKWVIRLGEDPEKFIHIHPGRNQEFVFRVKANHLKTAIVIFIDNQPDSIQDIQLSTAYINKIRAEILGLSPVRSIAECSKALSALKFLIARLAPICNR